MPPGLPAGSESAIPALLGWPPDGPVDRGALEAAARGDRAGRGRARLARRLRRGRTAGAAAPPTPGARPCASCDGHLRRHRVLPAGRPPAAGLRAGRRCRPCRPGCAPGPRARRRPSCSTSRTVVIAAAGAAAGLARLLGARVVVPPGATGQPGHRPRAPRRRPPQRAAGGGRLQRGRARGRRPTRRPTSATAPAKVAALERVDDELLPAARATRRRLRRHAACVPRPRLRPRHRASTTPRPCRALRLDARAPPSDGPERTAHRARRGARSPPYDVARGARGSRDPAHRRRRHQLRRRQDHGRLRADRRAARPRAARCRGSRSARTTSTRATTRSPRAGPGRNLDAFLSGPELIAPLVRHGGHGRRRGRDRGRDGAVRRRLGPRRAGLDRRTSRSCSTRRWCWSSTPPRWRAPPRRSCTATATFDPDIERRRGDLQPGRLRHPRAAAARGDRAARRAGRRRAAARRARHARPSATSASCPAGEREGAHARRAGRARRRRSER